MTDFACQVVAATVGRTADIVVRCDPSHPVYSLQHVVSLMEGAGLSVHTSSHCHSSLASSLPSALVSFLPCSKVSRSQAKARLTVIWSSVGRECEVMVSPLTQTVIRGEVNLLRYLARLLPTLLKYETEPSLHCLDSLLDSVSSLSWASPRDRLPLLRALAANLSKSQYLAGKVG